MVIANRLAVYVDQIFADPAGYPALAAWMGLSWLYAMYVENFANYSLLYGSIGTVVVLMIWLYMSANVLILGAELNGTLVAMRKEAESG